MADTLKDPILSQAGRNGAAKRLAEIGGAQLSAPARDALQRIREMEDRVDPGRLLSKRERRQMARLRIEIEDRREQLSSLEREVIERHQSEIAAMRAEYERLTAPLVAA